MSSVVRWKQWAEKLTRETFTLYFACRDPRTPWYAKALALCVVGYAFSPIDLIHCSQSIGKRPFVRLRRSQGRLRQEATEDVAAVAVDAHRGPG